MAFGQASGPPAPARQVQELLTLLQEAGHTDFRDARGPMGFTQRQAAGKFTRDEVTGFLESLQSAADDQEAPPAAAPSASASAPASAGSVRSTRAEVLAAELRRRGWTVAEP